MSSKDIVIAFLSKVQYYVYQYFSGKGREIGLEYSMSEINIFGTASVKTTSIITSTTKKKIKTIEINSRILLEALIEPHIKFFDY